MFKNALDTCNIDGQLTNVRVEYVLYHSTPVFTGAACNKAKAYGCNPEDCPIVRDALQHQQE